ncbi:MAG: hypothetical protein KKF54_06695 [Candidatus Omnitrophica bacterium]|nr:hypothetical protein [Candidatus Omnitrophota bacterium]
MSIEKLMTAIIWGDTKGWIDPMFKDKDLESEKCRLNWEKSKEQLFANFKKAVGRAA